MTDQPLPPRPTGLDDLLAYVAENLPQDDPDRCAETLAAMPVADRPYTDTDLRAEAARQHYTATTDPDFMGIGEQMQGQEVTPGGGVAWDDFSDETFDAAQHAIDDLLGNAADTSRWAVDLGADGMQPDPRALDAGENRVRVHFAFAPDYPEADRTDLIEQFARFMTAGLS